jgi:hypothetical protein
MKSLEEKKLLVKMARAFNQPVDQALLESIEREERLAKLLFQNLQKLIYNRQKNIKFSKLQIILIQFQIQRNLH